MAHTFNPFPKYNRTGREGRIFQTILLILIIAICTGFIFYINMYQPSTINPVQDISNLFEVKSTEEISAAIPTKPEFVDLSMIEEDLSIIEKNLATIDTLENL